MSKQRGFTLIELLIVVAIIAILAALIIMMISEARAKGRDSERVSDMKQLQNALELHYTDFLAYPQEIYGNPSALEENGYISKVPIDPIGGQYQYVGLYSGCGQYHIGITLERNNKVLDTDADLDGAAEYGLPAVAACGSAGNPIDGTDPVYDLMQ